MGETVDDLAVCADRLREHGYAVVMKVEQDNWARWLQESYAETRAAHDQNQRLLWQVMDLTRRCDELTAPSRPRWLRRAHQFLHRYEYTEPLVFGHRGANP